MQVDPFRQWGEGGDFVALRGDLALSDHGLAGVQRVAVQAGREPSQCEGVRRGGGRPEPFSQFGVGGGGEAGDGGQRLGSTEDGEQAQREQGAQAVAAASDLVGIGYPAQHLGQAGELRRFRIRADGVGVSAVALQDTRSGRTACERDPCP